MLTKLSLTVLALAFFLQAAVALPFWGWHAHPKGFSGFNGTESYPTGAAAPTGIPTGFPTGFSHPTGYPAPPMGGHHMKPEAGFEHEGFGHIKRFEGPRQPHGFGNFPHGPEGPHAAPYGPAAGGYPVPTGHAFPTGFPFPTGHAFPTGYPFPTGTGAFPTARPTGY